MSLSEEYFLGILLVVEIKHDERGHLWMESLDFLRALCQIFST